MIISKCLLLLSIKTPKTSHSVKDTVTTLKAKYPITFSKAILLRCSKQDKTDQSIFPIVSFSALYFFKEPRQTKLRSHVIDKLKRRSKSNSQTCIGRAAGLSHCYAPFIRVIGYQLSFLILLMTVKGD